MLQFKKKVVSCFLYSLLKFDKINNIECQEWRQSVTLWTQRQSINLFCLFKYSCYSDDDDEDVYAVLVKLIF